MLNPRLIDRARPWIEEQLGFPLPLRAPRGLPIVRAVPGREAAAPLWAIRVGPIVAVSVRPEIEAETRRVVLGLHPDQLFSVLGTYELSRVTLPHGAAVWGPVPNYIADESTWRPAGDSRPVRLSTKRLAAVDWDTFWHCDKKPLGAFGIYEAGNLEALATVADHGESMWEIGVDVTPDLKSRGLGRAVVSAAGDWILESGQTVHATAAFWNVPSSRTLRSVGMQYVFSTMTARPGPFRVPPQPLGRPLPDAGVYDQYPRWAMNHDILPRPEG